MCQAGSMELYLHCRIINMLSRKHGIDRDSDIDSDMDTEHNICEKLGHGHGKDTEKI